MVRFFCNLFVLGMTFFSTIEACSYTSVVPEKPASKQRLEQLIQDITKNNSGDVYRILGENQDLLNMQDSRGYTPLHWAIDSGRTLFAEKLIFFYEVDVNLQDKDGWTPLHYACQAWNEAVVMMLLLKGADTQLKNGCGKTALDCLFGQRLLKNLHGLVTKLDAESKNYGVYVEHFAQNC